MPSGSFSALIGGLGIFVVVVGYPFALLILRRKKSDEPLPELSAYPSVTIITAARNAEALIRPKIENFHQLDYPSERLNLMIAADAPTDKTCSLVRAAADTRIQLVEQKEHLGKAAAMNRAVEQADSDLLLFSDADAQLVSNAVQKLVRHFVDPKVGGVCGQRRTLRSELRLRDAQQTYINFDSALKKNESSHGYISANDGKIHMIRRERFTPIPSDCGDDIYTLLAVLDQGCQFLFEPEAVAEVRVPSRDAWHEIQRRRRIVTRSMTSTLRMHRLLNPFRYGWISAGLLINKIGRRLMPFFLLLLLFGLFRMVLASAMVETLPIIILGGLFAATIYGLVARLTGSALLIKPLRLAFYVLVGFVGMALGMIDFLSGRRVSVWEPRKTGTRI